MSETSAAFKARYRGNPRLHENTPLGFYADGWEDAIESVGLERLQGQIDRLQFCLQQARIVLEHFSKTLPNAEHRKWAQGGLIASDVDADERTRNLYR